MLPFQMTDASFCSAKKTRDESPAIYENLDHLIIVCCHAIWLGGATNGEDESEWLIEPFQKGESITFRRHAEMGCDILKASKEGKGLLVFSGAATKPDRSTVSESESYLNYVKAKGYLPTHLMPYARTDAYATDSFQNLLFPIIYYYKLCARPPSRITLVSHAFKEPRFVDLHLPAICWPSERFKFVGLDPEMDDDKRAKVLQLEKANGYAPWSEDVHGAGENLATKRRARGWRSERVASMIDGIGIPDIETLVNPHVVRNTCAWEIYSKQKRFWDNLEF